MRRISVLAAVLPASLGLALVQSTLGFPVPADLVWWLRVAAFFLWLGALVAGVLRADEWAPRAGKTELFLSGLTIVVMVLLAVGLALIGASPETQLGVAVILLGWTIRRLGRRWQESALSGSGTILIALGVAGTIASFFADWRGWTPFVSGVLGGTVVLLQGLWSGLLPRRTGGFR